MRLMLPSVLLLSCLAGCSGDYIVTTSEQVGPAGGCAATVARLERREFWILTPSVKQAVVRFQVEQEPLRAAYTDKKGFVCADVPLPKDEGCYQMQIAHLDRNGNEVCQAAPVYVWPADAKIVGVTARSALAGNAASRTETKERLEQLAQSSHIIYFSGKDVDELDEVNEKLRKANFPPGPVLHWSRWEHLCKIFPNLRRDDLSIKG